MGISGGGQVFKPSHLGFTLAETLITLGIIGVVATLTLPNLISNYKNKVFVAQLQKVYNQMSNAAAQIMVDEDVDNLSDTYLYGTFDDDAPKRVGRFLKKYFKVTKDCGVGGQTDCFALRYKTLDKSDDFPVGMGTHNWSQAYCVAINTGTSICMLPFYYSYSNDVYHAGAGVMVDVNGKNGPNINGRDLFSFYVYSDGKIGYHYMPNKESIGFYDGCGTAEIYGSCIDQIMAAGWKMDY